MTDPLLCRACWPTHRSGLPRNECVVIQKGDTDWGALDKFETATSDCFRAYPVGYRYKYSNLGYDLLGRIIEQNRHMGYSPYLKANLLNDLGMERNIFNSNDITEPKNLVIMYMDHYSRTVDPETMGLGWKTTRIRGTELLIWHDGAPTEGIGSLIAFLPDNGTGELLGDIYTISMDQQVLKISGVFGPIIPVDDNFLLPEK